MLNEQEIRKIVRDEMNSQKYQSGSPIISPHVHDGVTSPRINQASITPAIRTSGSITFAHTGAYTIQTNGNPNPTLILCYGIVVDDAGSPTVRIHTFGTAQLGPSYYLQPNTQSTVKVGGPKQPFIQSSTYLSVAASGPAFHALTDEGHIVDVEYGGSTHARMTLLSFTPSTITLNVDNLDSGWNIIVNIVVI